MDKQDTIHHALLCRQVKRLDRRGLHSMEEWISPEVCVRLSYKDEVHKLWAWPYPEDDLGDVCLGHVLLDIASGQSHWRGQAIAVGPYSYSVHLMPAEQPVHADSLFSLSAQRVLRAMRIFLTLPGVCPGLWEKTGCFHRAGLLDPKTGEIVCLVEDIGRHNCLDRLAGWACRTGVLLAGYVLLLSCRITASLYAKARRAGFTCLVSRAAVTANPVDLALSEGVVVVGFCRPEEERLTLFADRDGRLTLEPYD